jgi:hypothetical protein
MKIKKNKKLKEILVASVLQRVKFLAQDLQNESIYRQNQATHKYQNSRVEILYAYTLKSFNVAITFRFLNNPVFVFSIGYTRFL